MVLILGNVGDSHKITILKAWYTFKIFQVLSMVIELSTFECFRVVFKPSFFRHVTWDSLGSLRRGKKKCMPCIWKNYGIPGPWLGMRITIFTCN
jgi:hypothetical protein